MKNRIHRKMKAIAMVMSLISIPVAIILLLSNERTYGSYMGNLYELNYWWEALLLTVAISCIVCRLCRNSQYSELIIKASALISVTVVVLVIMTKSWWGLVKLCDSLSNSNDGVFVFIIMFPITVMLLVYLYCSISKFVADKKAVKLA